MLLVSIVGEKIAITDREDMNKKVNKRLKMTNK